MFIFLWNYIEYFFGIDSFFTQNYVFCNQSTMGFNNLKCWRNLISCCQIVLPNIICVDVCGCVFVVYMNLSLKWSNKYIYLNMTFPALFVSRVVILTTRPYTFLVIALRVYACVRACVQAVTFYDHQGAMSTRIWALAGDPNNGCVPTVTPSTVTDSLRNYD